MRLRKKYLSPGSTKKFLALLEEEANKHREKTTPYALAGIPRNTYYRWRKRKLIPEAEALRIAGVLALDHKDFANFQIETEDLILKRTETLTDLVNLYAIFHKRGNKDDFFICRTRLLTLIQQRLTEAGYESLLTASRTRLEQDAWLTVKSVGDVKLLIVRILPTQKGGPFLMVETEEAEPVSGCTMCSTNIKRFIRVIHSAFTKEENMQMELDHQAEILIQKEHVHKYHSSSPKIF